MSNSLKTTDERFARLEAIEKRIFLACRRGLEETRNIARELIIIQDEELWSERSDSFRNYIIVDLHLDYRSATRWMNIQRTMDALEEAEVKQLPSNESQVAALERLPDIADRIKAWESAVNLAEREEAELTVNIVNGAVELLIEANAKTEERRAKKKKSNTPKPVRQIEIDIEEEPEEAEEEEEQTVSASRITLSEEGELALDRIKDICGKSYAQAVEDGTVKISEETLIKWAAQPEATVYNLAYYLVEQGWTLNKAMAYEQQALGDSTTLKNLTMLARARGGTYRFDFEEFVVTLIERV